MLCCAAGAEIFGLFTTKKGGNPSFLAVFNTRKPGFRPPLAAQSLISRNPDLISRNSLFPEIHPIFPLFPEILDPHPPPPPRGGVSTSLVRAQGWWDFSIFPYKIVKIFRLRRANDSVLLFPETMTFPTHIIGSPLPY